MGIYLYGIRKLAKPQIVTREDGATITVAHCLSYVSKPYWGWRGIEDRYSRLAMGRIHAAYGDTFTGYVLFGHSILSWVGAPTWLDGGNYHKGTTQWGVATDLVEASSRSEDDHKARLSRARLPTLLVQEGRITRRLEGRAVVTSRDHRVLDSRDVYAVRLLSGAVQLRGGPEAVTLNPLASDDQVQAEFRAYLQVVQDWLTERTPDPTPVPVPVPPPAPTHEDCLRAAGWI